MPQQHQTQIPISYLSTQQIVPGDIVNVNHSDRYTGITTTKVYRVVTVDKVNEIASCILVSETGFRV
jgi:hypothetical protein